MIARQARFGSMALLLALAAWLALPPPASCERRTVAIEFVIAAPHYEHLQSLAPEIESALGEEILPVVQDRFGFVDWRPRSELATEPAGTWLVRLEQEDKEFDGVPLSRLSLVHYARTAEGEEEIAQTPNNRTLYDFFALPAASPARLEDDLVEKLREQLDEQLLAGVDDQLLDRVSVGDSLIVAPEAEHLVVAVKMGELRVREETELRVEFSAANAGKGRMKTEARGPITEGEWAGFIKPLVREVEVGNTFLPSPGFWHEDFASLLASLTDVQIFITAFKPDRAAGSPTDDGVILDLPEVD